MSSWMKSVDSFQKFRSDVQVKTTSGAIVSTVAIITMIVLFFNELSIFLSIEKTNHLTVDSTRGEKLRINLNMEFQHISCSMLTLDVMDLAGSHQEDVDHTIHKTRLDKHGKTIGVALKDDIGNIQSSKMNETELALKQQHIRAPGYCGACYGAESKPGECCNTCQKVKDAYATKGWAFASFKAIEQCVEEHAADEVFIFNGEGCQIEGFLEVNKVAGNFHLAPGKSFQSGAAHIHDIQDMDPTIFNVSHTIHHLSFGDYFPGIVNLLDGNSQHLLEPSTVYQYYLKIVRTTYTYLDGRFTRSNQFSVTEHNAKMGGLDGKGLPGVFFFYDLSPIMVKYEEKNRSILHFLTQLCAIIGGVFTVSGIIDRILHATVKRFENKVETGKFS